MTKKIVAYITSLITMAIFILIFSVFAYVYYAYTYVYQTPLGLYETIIMLVYGYVSISCSMAVSNFIETKLIGGNENEKS